MASTKGSPRSASSQTSLAEAAAAPWEQVLEGKEVLDPGEPAPPPPLPPLEGGGGPSQHASSAEVPPHLSTPELLFWVAVAAAQPVCVSMIGVLVRYLEVDVTPPVPPLRVTCLIVLFALPAILLLHALPLWVLFRLNRCRQGQRQQQQQGWRQDVEDGKGAAATAGDDSVGSSCGGGEGIPGATGVGTDRAPSCGEGGGVAPPLPAAGASKLSGLARVPTLPGLSRVYDRHPNMHRRLLVLVVSACYLGVIVLLNTAPKLLDPAVVMLVTMFTVVGVALVGRVFLGVPLPRSLPPAAALMIGGSAMVLIPDILDGAGEPGSLTSVQAWLGFVASVGALCLTILFITLVQAFKRANLGAFEVLYWIAGLTAVFVLPVSLGVEGADWGAQFRGFGAGAWGALLFSACVGHVGAGPALQWATWKLPGGGNSASLFFGLRLIVSVVASKIILGTTIIRTGLQVAGAVLVVVAITGYMLIQWWAGRQAAHRLAAARSPA